MIEHWRPIKGFEGKYEISSLGKVKSIGTYNTCKKGIMIPMVDTSGYEHVRLYSGDKVIDKSVHRLVAETFLPNPDNLKYVNHKDEDRRNNSIDNLEWCTNRYNITYSLGKKVIQLSKEGIQLRAFNSIAEASKEFNIPTTNISKCCKGIRKSAGNFIWRYE